jgi:hypothetical protein
LLQGQEANVTTEHANEVDQAQEQLDGEQEQAAPSGPQYVTVDQFQEMRQMMQRMEQSFRSSQGIVSKGLDAVRRDFDQKLDQRLTGLSDQQQQQAMEREIETLPEEQREMARWVAKQTQASQQVVRQMVSTVATPETSQATPPANEAWARVQKIVTSAGLNPNDSRIDYYSLADESIDEDSRTGRFIQSLVRAAGQSSPGPAGVGAPAPIAAATANPPSERPAVRQTQAQTEDDVLNLYISGQINADEKNKRMEGLRRRSS